MDILVVDDEEDLRELLEYNLTKDGYRVLKAAAGLEAIAIARKEHPNIILLDLMLPDVSGQDVCRILKGDEATSDIHIVMLTAKSSEEDIVKGLNIGADDYICKPFSLKVLSARIKALERRYASAVDPKATSTLSVGLLKIESARYEAIYNGKPIPLSATEFHILELLVKDRGIVLTRRKILTSIKGDDYPATDRAIDVQILAIRRKLRAVGSPELIHTVRGVGYKID